MSESLWKDLENNHVTLGDRKRIADYGRDLERQLASESEMLGTANRANIDLGNKNLELRKKLAEVTASAAAMRERCAVIAEGGDSPLNFPEVSYYARRIAEMIRKIDLPRAGSDLLAELARLREAGDRLADSLKGETVSLRIAEHLGAYLEARGRSDPDSFQ